MLDTRKTTPGLRALEKQAVAAGGGRNHRMGLHDAILVKDNHIALAGGVGEATRRALERRPARHRGRGRVRARSTTCEEALEAGAERLLLDNMTPDQMREARGSSTAGRAHARGVGRHHAGPPPRNRRHWRTIRVTGLSDPFGARPRPLHDDRPVE